MTYAILVSANQLNREEWQFYLKGGIVLDKSGQMPNPAPDWISEESWDNITELESLANFSGISDSLSAVRTMKIANNVLIDCYCNRVLRIEGKRSEYALLFNFYIRMIIIDLYNPFQDVQLWKEWYSQESPENSELPGEWEGKCNELQRMLIIRSLRPDRVTFIASSFVSNNLGKKFVEPPVLDLVEIYGDSSNLSPLVFVLSPGK